MIAPNDNSTIKFIYKVERDGGYSLTRINRPNETGTYVIRQFSDGTKIKAWRS